MTSAIKMKDMTNIDIAHQLQEVAARKQQAHKELHELNGKKRKIGKRKENSKST